MITKEKNAVFVIDGVTFGFRFTTWAFKQTQNSLNAKSLNEVLRRIGFDDGELDTSAYIIFLLEAAKEYNYHQKIDTVLTERDASDYIDLMGGIMQSLKLISEALYQFIPKNSNPLEEAGGNTQ